MIRGPARSSQRRVLNGRSSLMTPQATPTPHAVHTRTRTTPARIVRAPDRSQISLRLNSQWTWFGLGPRRRHATSARTARQPAIEPAPSPRLALTHIAIRRPDGPTPPQCAVRGAAAHGRDPIEFGNCNSQFAVGPRWLRLCRGVAPAAAPPPPHAIAWDTAVQRIFSHISSSQKKCTAED